MGLIIIEIGSKTIFIISYEDVYTFGERHWTTWLGVAKIKPHCAL